DARITPTGDGFSLDLYHLLEDDGAPITDNDRQVEIEQALWGSLRGAADAPFAVSRRAPRQARMFNTPTQIALSVDERNRRSVLELTAGDRPGLLCEVGKVLMAERVELHAAKIMTVGERAEDVFYLTDFDNRPLEPAAAERLRERLVQALDERQAALREPAGGAARRLRRLAHAALWTQRRERRCRHHGAAGERHTRGAVRVRAGGGGWRACTARRHAQSLLPDLRGRGAAGRRTPLSAGYHG